MSSSYASHTAMNESKQTNKQTNKQYLEWRYPHTHHILRCTKANKQTNKTNTQTNNTWYDVILVRITYWDARKQSGRKCNIIRLCFDSKGFPISLRSSKQLAYNTLAERQTHKSAHAHIIQPHVWLNMHFHINSQKHSSTYNICKLERLWMDCNHLIPQLH